MRELRRLVDGRYARARIDILALMCDEAEAEGLHLVAVRWDDVVFPRGSLVLEFTDEPPCTLSLNGRLAYVVDLWSRLDGEPTRFMLEAPDPEGAMARAMALRPVRIRFVGDLQ